MRRPKTPYAAACLIVGVDSKYMAETLGVARQTAKMWSNGSRRAPKRAWALLRMEFARIAKDSEAKNPKDPRGLALRLLMAP